MERLKRMSRGDVRLGLARIPHRTAEPAAAAVGCDIGLCRQPGTEALDVAGGKSAVKVLVWRGVFFCFVVGFFPPAVSG